jgi:hypothetical protein
MIILLGLKLDSNIQFIQNQVTATFLINFISRLNYVLTNKTRYKSGFY